MVAPVINRLQSRMAREINYYAVMHNAGNLIFVVLKKEQISQRYLRLIKEAVRRKKA